MYGSIVNHLVKYSVIARRRFRPRNALVLLLFTTPLLWALSPADLRDDDPILRAMYHKENFLTSESRVPNPPVETRDNLFAIVRSKPNDAEGYKALAEVEIELLDLSKADRHMKDYLSKSSNKDVAFNDLENYYHRRLRFQEEFGAILEHAFLLKPDPDDVSHNTGRFALLNRALQHVKKYGLKEDPAVYHQALIDSYPADPSLYLNFIQYLRGENRKEAAVAQVEKFHSKFPDLISKYLITKSSLLPADEASALLQQNYNPLWDIELLRTMDSYLLQTGRKKQYLASIKEKLQQNPLDIDAVSRLFYAFYLSDNLPEAQNVLNDYRLLKDKAIAETKTFWNGSELYLLSRLLQIIGDLNDSARFYNALYFHLRAHPSDAKANVTAADAVHGLFEILLAAEERPIQIGAGNLDYYKDIATADQNPGVLNGILSLLLNGTKPSEEFSAQEDKATGYFNRGLAARVLQLMQRDYPASHHLPEMYKNILRVYEKYGQDRLIVTQGEQFLKNYASSAEVFDVAVAVIDAYGRLNEPENEWKVYERVLPLAANRKNTGLQDSISTSVQTPTRVLDYDYFLNRYIGSLTQNRKYLEVLRLYKDQISAYPNKEKLYEDLSQYLSANQLFEEEKKAYETAIEQFRTANWFEKLARWYLRRKRTQAFTEISQRIMDTFKGTEVENYLRAVNPDLPPNEGLSLALNQYAHNRFPHNLEFARNLLSSYFNSGKPTQEWFALSEEYYFVDEAIRNAYLQQLASTHSIPQSSTIIPSNTVLTRFKGDLELRSSHFEEALPFFEKLTQSYTSDVPLNLVVADLKRSLGIRHVGYYEESAHIREHLASIDPGDASLWTTAGETLADIGSYERAKSYWQKIVPIDPQNPERYLEVATILWDYYLFDDALDLIQSARNITKQPGLYAYEAGAIYESKRDYPAAIREYANSFLYESENAQARLTELYKRPKLKTTITEQLAHRLDSNLQDQRWWTGILHFYSEQNEKEQVRSLILKAESSLKPDAFHNMADELKDLSRRLGFFDLQERLIRKQIQLASGDVEKILLQVELGQFYESRKDTGQANSVYGGLYGNHRKSVGVIDQVISYYWRTDQFEKTLQTYREVLASANPQYKKKYLREVAYKLKERKQYPEALIAAKELAAQEPLNAEYFQLIASIYAEQKDYKSFSSHYEEGIRRVARSSLSPEQKRDQIALYRKAIIQADLILQDYTAAVDQYIEIVNRDAESGEQIHAAASFAFQYNLLDRLVSYYEKTSKSSPRDHRWRVILGKLYLFSRDYQRAIENFQAAIDLRPERTDIYEQLGDTFQRRGDYTNALRISEKLYELTYGSHRWLEQMAMLQARLGQKKKALELYDRTLGNLSDSQKNFALCEKALEWGEAKSAIEFGKAALESFLADVSQGLDSSGLQKYLQALVRSGSSIEALHVLEQALHRVRVDKKKATFDTASLQSAEYILRDSMVREYPELVKQYLTGDQLESLDQEVRNLLKRTNGPNQDIIQFYLPLAKAAMLSGLEETLLRQLAGQDWPENKKSNERYYRGELKKFLFDRGRFSAAGDWLSSKWRKGRKTCQYLNDGAEAAEAYRLAGMHDAELNVLRDYYRLGAGCQSPPEPVERYLSLLYSSNLKVELEQVARKANLTVANYFVRKNDRTLAQIAIRSLAAQKDNAWLNMHEAMLGWKLRQNDPWFQQKFIAALDLRPIGEQLAQHVDENSSVVGDNWFYYARKYGEYLWWTGDQENAKSFLPSDLEGMSTSADHQDRLGLFYLTEKNFPQAIAHFDLALSLNSKDPNFLDHKAQALAGLGRKEESLQLWDQMFRDYGEQTYDLYLQEAVKYGFTDKAKTNLLPHIKESIEKSGYSNLGAVLPSYLGMFDEKGQALLVKEWVPLAPSPEDFAISLLRSRFLKPEVQLQVYQSLREYLHSWMLNAKGEELVNVRAKWIRWTLALAEAFMNTNEFSQADQLVTEAEKVIETADDPELKKSEDNQKLLILKTRILAHLGRKDEVVKVMSDYNAAFGNSPSADFVTKIYEALKDEKFEDLGRSILKSFYEKALSSGEGSSTDYVGLAEIYVEEGDVKKGTALLEKMIYGQEEDLNGFEVAANLLEKHQVWQEAVGFRSELARRINWDTANQSMLAVDLLKLSRKEEAARVALSVLNSNLSKVQDRAKAARVYGSAVATGLAGPPEMRAIEQFIRTKNANQSAPETQRNIYYSEYRKLVLELVNEPDGGLSLAQVYIDPSNEEARLAAFKSLQKDGRCEAALEILDPKDVRHMGYSEQELNFPIPQDEYRRNYDSDEEDAEKYPIEKMELPEAQIKELALKAAACTDKVEDLYGQTFFLRMALAHSTNSQDQSELEKRIAEVEDLTLKLNEIRSKPPVITKNLGRANE